MPVQQLTEGESDMFLAVALICEAFQEKRAAAEVRRVRDWYDGSGVGQRKAAAFSDFVRRTVGR